MNLQQRYERLTPSQKREFERMKRPSMLTDWKQLTHEEIITRLERQAEKKDSSQFASIATRPKVLVKSEWQTILKKKKRHPALVRAGVSGFSKPKRIKHKTKSHIVVVKDGDKVKTIRFGQKGVKTNQTAGQRKAFKSRHAKNIKRGKMSAAYWANKVKWSPSKTKEKKNKSWRKGS